MPDLKNKRSVTIVYLLLRASVILVLIAQIFNRNFENVFLCVLTLFLFGVPNMVQHRLDIELPNTLEIIILLFIYAAEILGEINAYYVTFPYWDTVLHTLNGFLCAAVGFSLLDILNREEKIGFSLSPLYLAIVAFCFSMTVGVIWEFFECTMDQLFLLDMQKDSVVNTIGSVMLDPTGGNNPGVIRRRPLVWAATWILACWIRWRTFSSTLSVRSRSRLSAISMCAAAVKTSLPSALSPW